MKKIIFLLIICIPLKGFSSKLSDAYKALEIYDYFKAKKLFYRSLSNYPAESSFGLATIFFRNDNPFSNIDSAAKYISVSKNQLNDTVTFFSYHINEKTIRALADEICKKGFEKYTSNHSVSQLNHFLKSFYFAHDSLLTKTYYLRDEKILGNYLFHKSSDSITTFLLKYPESVLYNEAQKAFYNFEYFEQTKDNLAHQFKTFIKNYPRNPYVLTAENKLFELTKQLHHTDSLYVFIKKYSSRATEEEAWKMLYSASVKNYNEKELSRFIAKYPDYPYQVDILNEIDLSQKVVLPLKNNDSKFGYIDTLGHWVISPIYDDADFFNEGFASVCKNDSCFYINKEGVKTSGFYFNETENYQNGIAIVKKGDLYFLINRAGQLITKGYEDINEMSDHLFVCKQANFYGAINSKGETTVPFIYNKLGNFKNGYAYYLSLYYGLVDINNNRLKAQWDWVSDVDTNSLAIVRKDTKFGLMQLNEKLLLNSEFDFIALCQKGIYLVVKNNLYGFYDAIGHCFITSVSYEYEKAFEANYYTDGNQFKLLQNKEVALIDANGKFNINFGIYTNLFFAKEGIIRIQKENKFGFVDRKLKPITIVEYDDATDFTNGVAIVSKKGTSQLINKLGKALFSIKDGEIMLQESTYYQTKLGGLYGLINNSGEILLPIEYLSIESLSDHLFKCKKNKDLFLYNSSIKSLVKL